MSVHDSVVGDAEDRFSKGISACLAAPGKERAAVADGCLRLEAFMDYRSILLFLTAFLHLLVGGFVLRCNPRGNVHRTLFLETLMMAFWATFMGATWIVPKNYLLICGRSAHAASLFICTGFVALGLIFPDGRTQTPRWLRVAVWIVGIIISLFAVLTPYLIIRAEMKAGTLGFEYGPLAYAYYSYLPLCLIWGLGDLARRYRHFRGIGRLQIQYLWAGLAITALLNIPSNMVAPLLGISSVVWMGPIFSLAFVGIVAHAIVRYRMMGIRVFVGRGVAYALALGVMIALFLGILSLVNQHLGGMHPSAISAVALVIAILFQPLHSRIHSGVSRYFFRPGYDYQAIVSGSSHALSAVLDLDRAIAYLLSTVIKNLQVEQSMLLIRDRASRGFRLHTARYGWENTEAGLPQDAGLVSGSPLVTYLESTREAVVREELERLLDPEQAGAISDEMAHFAAAVAVPLFAGNILLAVLLVGPKLSGDIFSVQDLRLLSTLGAQAAAAIANAQLHQEAMQAERLVTVGQVAAGIAHEVKNPLVAVRTFAELLPEQYEDPEFRDGFSKLVLSEVDRIDGLIGQLLNYARPKPPRLEPVEVNTVMHDTLQLIGYQVTKNDIALQETYAPHLPLVMADISQLRQVFLNIALNAVQIMPRGGTLRMATRALGEEKAYRGAPYLLPEEKMVEIEIANTGPTIPPEHLDKLFEPFFSTRSGGTGLGLSICKRIVTEHQGQIRAATTEEGLTAFTIRLPVAAAEGTPPEAVPAQSVALAGIGGAQG